MRYSLLAGGKRIRPVLALATARAIGRDPHELLPLAAAIELIHTYSLIHDDLPAMDDDDLRRGRPTYHKVFGEDVAILAGDGLYAEAFRHVLTRQARRAGRPPRRARRAGAATGVNGMVGGQYIDVAGRAAPGLSGLRRLHELKTGRLIGASRRVRTAAGGRGRDRDSRLSALRRRARRAVPDRGRHPRRDRHGRRLGKPQGSDERHGKRTYVTEFGLDGARELAGAVARAGAARRLDAGGAGGRRRARADHRLHLHAGPHDPRLLDRIDRPQDLHGTRATTSSQQVAQEVREHIIDTVGEIGGHFGANLGTCELAVALHSLLDSPRDKILWDVGHQAYPHKVLTGRRDQLATIRQYEGLAPFCSIARVRARHHGRRATPRPSIGYAVGLKEAHAPLRGETDAGKVVAVIGDGAMTGGVAFEAIHQAGGLGTPIVVVLNDNGMSIAPNVGALSRYFNRVRLNPKLWHAREGVEGGLDEPAGAASARRSSASGRS